MRLLALLLAACAARQPAAPSEHIQFACPRLCPPGEFAPVGMLDDCCVDQQGRRWSSAAWGRR